MINRQPRLRVTPNAAAPGERQARSEWQPRARLLVIAVLAVLIVIVAIIAVTVIATARDAAPADAQDPATSTAAPGAEENPYQVQRREGVERLLNSFAQAQRLDAAAVPDLIDPAAPGGFLQAQQQIAENISSIAPPEFRYEIGSPRGLNGTETPVPASVFDRLDESGVTDSWAVPAVLVYRLASDVAPTRQQVNLIVARRGDEWKVVSDNEVQEFGMSDGTTLGSYRGPWSFGRTETTTVEMPGSQRSSQIIAHPGTRALAERVAATLPQSVATVQQFWGSDWANAATIVVTETAEEFHALTRSAPGQGEGAAAVTISDGADSGGAGPVGQRIILSPAAGDRLTATTVPIVLTHELFHLAARALTTDPAPQWLTEGTAEYVGRLGRGASVQQAAPDLMAALAAGSIEPQFPVDTAFTIDSATAAVAYQQAYAICRYIAEKYGEDRLRTIYAQLARPSDQVTLDRAFEANLGRTSAQMLSDWLRWLAQQPR